MNRPASPELRALMESSEFKESFAGFRLDITHATESVDRVNQTCATLSSEGIANDLASVRCRNLYANLEQIPFISALLNEDSFTIPEKVAEQLYGKDKEKLGEYLEKILLVYQLLLGKLYVLADPSKDISLDMLEDATQLAIQLKEMVHDVATFVDDISKYI